MTCSRVLEGRVPFREGKVCDGKDDGNGATKAPTCDINIGEAIVLAIESDANMLTIDTLPNVSEQWITVNTRRQRFASSSL